MTSDELEKLWTDEENWRFGLIYHAPEDPRVVVPKRIRWTGYTMNFAHKAAGVVLVTVIVLVLLPFLLILRAPGPQTVPLMMVAFFAVVAAITVVCHWESTRER